MKFVLTVACFFAVAVVAAAQTDLSVGDLMSAKPSMLNLRSFGILKNEIDAAQLPDADFGLLEKNYLFGGLDNLDGHGDLTSSSTNPWLGGYWYNAYPLSFLINFNQTPASNVSSGTSTTQTTASKATGPVTTGSTTTNATYTWVTGSAATTYTRPVMMTALTDETHVTLNLKNLGLPLVSGLWLRYNWTETDTGSNTTVVTRNYADKNALTATAEPDPELVQERTNQQTGLNYGSEVTALIPFGFRTGTLQNRLTLGGSFYYGDQSTSQDDTGLKPKTKTISYLPGAQSWTTVSDATSAFITQALVSADWTLTVPPPKEEDAANLWKIVVDAKYLQPGRSWSLSNDSTSYTQADVASPTSYTKSISDQSVKLQALPRGLASVTSSKVWATPFGPSLGFSVKPTVSLNWANDILSSPAASDNQITQTTRVDKADNNGDGKYDNVADTITTTVVDYTGAALTNGGAITAIAGQKQAYQVSASLELPMVLTLSPAGWPLNFVVSAKPALSGTVSAVTQSDWTSSTTVTAEAGDGSSTTKTVTNTATNAADTTKATWNWSSTASYSFLTRMQFDENAKLDFGLNGSLLSFEGFTLQFTLSFPAPKVVLPVKSAAPAPAASTAPSPSGSPIPSTVPGPSAPTPASK